MTNLTRFDKSDADSPFMDFVRKEFTLGRGTPHRKMLADKTGGQAFVLGLGVSHARRLAAIDDIQMLPSLALPEQFVLKYAHGWSARGVMLLRRTAKGFFCLLALRDMTIDEVMERQSKVADSFEHQENEWIVEELIASTVPSRPIPFDYKCYCFGGEVAMIGQFDRNAFPVKAVLFNPNFTPMVHRRDYILASPNLQPGTPVVPLHAPQLLETARRLAAVAGSPFVSVDLYDSKTGPVFGEYTYSPGGTFRRMWLLERGIIDRFDRMFVEAEELQLEPPTTPAAKLPVPDMSDGEEFGILAGSVLNGSSRAASRLADLMEARSTHEFDFSAAWRSVAESLIRSQKNQVSDRQSFIRSRRDAADQVT